MRGSITLYEDQYQFYKELKSKRLLIAFVEYMFEDIEPTGLNKLEKVVRNSLKVRMENQKKKSFAGTQSHGGGRKGNQEKGEFSTDTEKQQKNNTETTEETTEKQEVEVKEEEKENNKRKYLDYVYLSDEEYKKICDRYGERVLREFINRLNNWIGEKPNLKSRQNRNSYFTILKWIDKEGIKELPKKQENESGIYDLPF